MPDQIVFNDGLSVLGTPIGTSALTGTLSVDYGTNTVTGTLGVSALGALSAQTHTPVSR